MGSITIRDKAVIAATTGLDDQRPEDRRLIVAAYRRVYEAGDDVSERAVLGRYRQLMKQDEAKEHAKRVEVKQEAAQGAAAAESAAELVRIEAEAEAEKRRAKALLARLVRIRIEGLLGAEPAVLAKQASLASLSKFIPAIEGMKLDDDGGLEEAAAAALEAAAQADKSRGDEAPDGALPLPGPVRQGDAIGWVVKGKPNA